MKMCGNIFVSMELSVYNNHTDFAREIDRYIFHCIIVFCMQWRWQMSVFNCIKNVSVAEIHVILLCVTFFSIVSIISLVWRRFLTVFYINAKKWQRALHTWIQFIDNERALVFKMSWMNEPLFSWIDNTRH